MVYNGSAKCVEYQFDIFWYFKKALEQNIGCETFSVIKIVKKSIRRTEEILDAYIRCHIRPHKHGAKSFIS